MQIDIAVFVCLDPLGGSIAMEGGRMKSESYESVWDSLADTEREAANLKARSALLYEIRKAVLS